MIRSLGALVAYQGLAVNCVRADGRKAFKNLAGGHLEVGD